jgi:hypothetical protein
MDSFKSSEASSLLSFATKPNLLLDVSVVRLKPDRFSAGRLLAIIDLARCGRFATS